MMEIFAVECMVVNSQLDKNKIKTSELIVDDKASKQMKSFAVYNFSNRTSVLNLHL